MFKNRMHVRFKFHKFLNISKNVKFPTNSFKNFQKSLVGQIFANFVEKIVYIHMAEV